MSGCSTINLLPLFDETRPEEVLAASNIAFNTLVRTGRGEEKTVMKVLLENINDGDQVVKKELDKLVKKEGKLIGLKMNSGKLFEKDSQIEIQMVHDILEVRKEKSVDSFAHGALTELIEHPVISAFIMEKWRFAKVLFHIHTRAFMSFLGIFCFFVFGDVFKSVRKYDNDLKMKNITTDNNITVSNNCSTGEVKEFYKDYSSVLYSVILVIIFLFICNQIIKVAKIYKKNEKEELKIKCINLGFLLLTFCVFSLALYVDRQPMSLCSSPFLSGWENGFFLIELLLLMFTALFTFRKIILLLVFREWKGAVTNLKEILEYLALLGAYTIMMYKGQLKQEKVAAGLTALGVCTAWAVFVLKMGEPRFTMFGNFIAMFYNILKRTSKYLLAILFLITGFGFAFWVLQASMEKAEDTFYFNIFNTEMYTFIISTGEFDFRDFFTDFDEGENKIIVLFAMILLFLMILFVTITLLNLQAVIIQDYERLKKDVYVQNLIFMSNYTHNMEVLVHNVKGFSYIFQYIFPWVKNTLKLGQAEILYCPYQLCSKACNPQTHIEPHFNQIINGFKLILEQNN